MEIRTILPQEVSRYQQEIAQLLGEDPSKQCDIANLIADLTENSHSAQGPLPETQVRLAAALEDQHLIGFCAGYSNPFRDDHSRFYVHTLFVKKSWRAHGIGQKLLQHMEQEARDLRLGSIYLKVSAAKRQVPSFFLNQNYQIERVKLERFVDENEIFDPIQERIRIVTPEFLSAHKDQFAQLYLLNDKAHILSESSTLEEASEQMDLLVTYLKKKQACVLCIDHDQDICAVIWAYPSGTGINRHMHFKQLTVSSEYRRRNLAQQLYSAAFMQMQKSDLRIARTFVDTANAATSRLHEKIGFLPTEFQLMKPLN